MDKRKIAKRDFHLIEGELDFFEKNHTIDSLQKTEMLSHYEVREKADFIKIVLIVGSLLIGAGILTFIAGNWAYLSKLTKFLLIIVSILIVNFIGFKLEERSPKTSRAIYYIGVILFGAGIFLIGQTFNLGGEFPSAFLLWAIGIIGIGVFLKDAIILSFAVGLLFTYTNVFYFSSLSEFPVMTAIVTPLLYFFSRHIKYNKVYIFLLNILALNTIVLILDKLITGKNSTLIITLLMFIVGITMYYLPVKNKSVKEAYGKILNIQGGFIHWITGFLLTFSGNWGVFSNTKANIVWGIAYFIFSLFLMNRGSLLSIFIVCSIILRFYVDVSYEFLPQSLVFIIGGLILVGFGFYFERQRRKGGEF